jgi:hypothetical protein
MRPHASWLFPQKNAKHFKEFGQSGSSGQFPNLPYPIVGAHPCMRPHASWLFPQKMQSILNPIGLIGLISPVSLKSKMPFQKAIPCGFV